MGAQTIKTKKEVKEHIICFRLGTRILNELNQAAKIKKSSRSLLILDGVKIVLSKFQKEGG